MTIVLLPGLDGTGVLFKLFAAALETEFNVIIVSYPLDEPLGYAELEVIAKKSLPENEHFIIVGESFSGPIAVSLAATFSSQCKALVLCCSFIRNPNPVALFSRPFIPFMPIYPKIPKFLLNYFLGRYATDSLCGDLANAIEKVSPSAIRARLMAVIDVDVSREFSSLDIPVLCLQSTDDRLVPRSASTAIARIEPEVQIIEMNAPHFLLQVAPVEAAERVAAFAHGS